MQPDHEQLCRWLLHYIAFLSSWKGAIQTQEDLCEGLRNSFVACLLCFATNVWNRQKKKSLHQCFYCQSSSGSVPWGKAWMQILFKFFCQRTCDELSMNAGGEQAVCHSLLLTVTRRKHLEAERSLWWKVSDVSPLLFFTLFTDLFGEHLQQSSWVVISRHLKSFIQWMRRAWSAGVKQAVSHP